MACPTTSGALAPGQLKGNWSNLLVPAKKRCMCRWECAKQSIVKLIRAMVPPSLLRRVSGSENPIRMNCTNSGTNLILVYVAGFAV